MVTDLTLVCSELEKPKFSPSPSEHDSFLGTAVLAMRGNMDSEQFNQVIERSVAAQKAEELVAKAEQEKLEDQAANKSDDVARLEGRSADIAATLAALRATESSLQGQVVASGGDLDDPALKTSDELQMALQDVYAKVDKTSGVGQITRQDLEQALGPDASPELRRQIEEALERNGDEIIEPDEENTVEVADNTTTADLDNLGDIQLASNNVYLAAFPWIGVSCVSGPNDTAQYI